MFCKLKHKIVAKYLCDSIVEIREKENGFTNILIKHDNPLNGLIVLHPIKEKGVPNCTAGFELDNIPILRYMKKGA